ncbi:cyclic nucleotide-gated ion channel [Musa troglodytarum]|uniref:Cyclic nucleotide-gated ion channel n=1 Tax=Musa troglodytarum TaxID=320322 RepID=A0A9E7E8T4_9LILI|nr:cyclic nucleotide-gated ion channel [Musa troglodytarum]
MSSGESSSRSHEEAEDGSQNKPSDSTRACDSQGKMAAWSGFGPCTKWVREWNCIYLLACALGLIVDPLFFYTLSVSGALKCIFVDGWFAVTVTALRCMIDAMHVWNIWLQLRMIYGAKRSGGGRGRRERRRGNFTPIYVKSKRGFF